MLTKVFIKNRKNLKIAIRLNINKTNKKLVFLEHGLCSRKEYPHMLVLEECFSKFGYNVINFDATNSINESDSSSEGITISGHCEDLEDVITWAKTQNFYTEPFALAGQSLGAISVVRFAGEHSNMVNLLMPVAFPYYDKREVKENTTVKYILEHGYCDKTSKSTGRSSRIKMAFVDDMKNLDLKPQIQKITADTYIIIGTKDTEKHKRNAKILYKMLKCKKQFYWLEGVPHDLANTPEDKEKFCNVITSILEKNNNN